MFKFRISEMYRRQAATCLFPLVLCWLFGSSSEALSTFGVSNTRPPTAKPTSPPAHKKNMWLCKLPLVQPLWFFLYLIGKCSGVFSPAFGVIKSESPLPPPLPTSPFGFGISSFGKANTDAPKPDTTTASPARACTRQAECAGISSSSCVRTHYDSVTRCLCGDNQTPVNGQCEAGHKTLYHICSDSDECNDGLICGVANITNNSPSHLRVLSPQDKICLCDGDSGFKEKEFTCNDADILKTSMLAVTIVSVMRKLVAY